MTQDNISTSKTNCCLGWVFAHKVRFAYVYVRKQIEYVCRWNMEHFTGWNYTLMRWMEGLHWSEDSLQYVGFENWQYDFWMWLLIEINSVHCAHLERPVQPPTQHLKERPATEQRETADLVNNYLLLHKYQWNLWSPKFLKASDRQTKRLASFHLPFKWSNFTSCLIYLFISVLISAYALKTWNCLLVIKFAI